LISIFEQDSLKLSLKRLSFFILYVIFAPIFLSITYLVDFFVFFGNLFTKPLVDEFRTDKHRVFKKESLIIFEETINEMILELKKKKHEAAKNGEDISVYYNKEGNF
jgi:hypothetical protein